MAKAIRPTPTIGPAPFASTGDVRKADNEGDYKGVVKTIQRTMAFLQHC
jgi:hypothetical protein